MPPPVDDFAAAFPDLAPFAQEFRGDLGQEFEHVDLATRGFVGGYTAFYRPSDESRSAYISFAMFGDATGAGSAMNEMMALEFTHTAAYNVGEGDESYSLTLPSATFVLLRQGRVLATIVMLHPEGENVRDGLRQLARDVAANIDDALAQ